MENNTSVVPSFFFGLGLSLIGHILRGLLLITQLAPSGSSVPAVVEYASTVLFLNHRGAFLIPHCRRPANAGTRFSRHCLSGGYLAFYINCSFGLLFQPGPFRGICSAIALVILILAALLRLTSCIIICGLD